MDKKILNILKCIKCNNTSLNLEISSMKNDEVWEGNIYCDRCKANYAIKQGIPIMLLESKNMSFSSTPELEEVLKFLSTTKKIRELVSQNSINAFSLDAGCGPGLYLKYFKGETVAFDINLYFLNLARKNYSGQNIIHYIAGDIKFLPFRDNVFDFVFNSSVLEHFKQDEIVSVLREFERVSKGLIQIDCPNCSYLTVVLPKILAKLKLYRLEGPLSGDSEELYHHSIITTNFLRREGYKVKGCIGYTTREQLNYQIGNVLDFLVYNFPYIAGTLIAFKNTK